MSAPAGLVIVDKPAGWTSHDVVARVRRLAGTRRVGHAGTLDPMATGVLVLGVERATKLLTYLVGARKTYRATIRLGIGTVTDDAEGEAVVTPGCRADAAAVRAAVAALTGAIQQRPSAVSAIKVDGRRSYARVRAGEQVELAARPVTVYRFEILAITPVDVPSPAPAAPTDPTQPVEPAPSLDPAPSVETPTGGPVTCLDVDCEVECSSGTYVRALARDLGAALGSAGHLTALRRTRVGPYGLDQARTLEELAAEFAVIPVADAARAAFPVREVDADQARALSHGQRLPAAGQDEGPVAVFDPDGELIAVVREEGGQARPVLVLRAAD